MDSDLGCIKLGPDCRLSRLYHLIKEPAATVRPQWLFRQLVRPARSGAVCFATHCTATSSGLSFSFGKWAVYRQTECLCPCSPIQWSFYIAPFLHLAFLLPLFPALAHLSRCRSLPGLRLPPAAHLPLLWHRGRPPREEGMGAHSVSGLPLAAECSSTPCGFKSCSDPRGNNACDKVPTVGSCGRPVVKTSMKTDSLVHPKLLNSIRILVSSEQSS